MGKRKTFRTKMVLPLRIWGTDATGKPFLQMAHTLDVSASGARLGGFQAKVKPGDTLGLQYRLHKSQFRVAWVGEAGTPSAHQIGLEYLEPDKKILGMEVPHEPLPDDYEPPEDPALTFSRQRQHTRHLVEGGAEVRAINSHSGVWGKLTDISLNGCYLQLTNPIPLHTRVRVLLKVGRTEIEMHGVVRTSHPQVGMGVEFHDPRSPRDVERLQGLILRLASGEPEQEAAATADTAPADLSARLQKANEELIAIEELLKSARPDANLLRHFRETLAHVRTTSWAVQTWSHTASGDEDAAPLGNYLNRERIRAATKLCKTLAREMKTANMAVEQRELQNLLSAVEDLFGHLAGFSLIEVEPPGRETAAEGGVTSPAAAYGKGSAGAGPAADAEGVAGGELEPMFASADARSEAATIPDEAAPSQGPEERHSKEGPRKKQSKRDKRRQR